jgi:hypothetical protein
MRSSLLNMVWWKYLVSSDGLILINNGSYGYTYNEFSEVLFFCLDFIVALYFLNHLVFFVLFGVFLRFVVFVLGRLFFIIFQYFLIYYYRLFLAFWVNYIILLVWGQYLVHFKFAEIPRLNVEGLLLLGSRCITFTFNILFYSIIPCFYIFISFRRLLLFGVVGEEFLLAMLSPALVAHCPGSALTPLQEDALHLWKKSSRTFLSLHKENFAFYTGRIPIPREFISTVYSVTQLAHVVNDGGFGKSGLIRNSDLAYPFFSFGNLGKKCQIAPPNMQLSKMVGGFSWSLFNQGILKDLFISEVNASKGDLTNILANICQDSERVFGRFAVKNVEEVEVLQAWVCANYYKVTVEKIFEAFPLVNFLRAQGRIGFTFSESLSGPSALALATNRVEVHTKPYLTHYASRGDIFPSRDFISTSVLLVEFPVLIAFVEKIFRADLAIDSVEISSGTLLKKQLGIENPGKGFGDYAVSLKSKGASVKEIILLDAKNYSLRSDCLDDLEWHVDLMINRLEKSKVLFSTGFNLKLAFSINFNQAFSK